MEPLTLDERDALAQSLDPVQRSADREAEQAREAQRAAAELADADEIREAIPATIQAVNEALLDLTASMNAHVEARDKYTAARSAAKAIQARARTAGIDVEVVPSYADLVLRDRSARGLNSEWLVTLSSQIR